MDICWFDAQSCWLHDKMSVGKMKNHTLCNYVKQKRLLTELFFSTLPELTRRQTFSIFPTAIIILRFHFHLNQKLSSLEFLETDLSRQRRKSYHHWDLAVFWPTANAICPRPILPPNSIPARLQKTTSNTVTGASKPHRKPTLHGSVLWNTQSGGQVWEQTTTAVREKKGKMCWLLTERLSVINENI